MRDRLRKAGWGALGRVLYAALVVAESLTVLAVAGAVAGEWAAAKLHDWVDRARGRT